MADPLSLLIKSTFDATGITAATNSINRMDGQIARVTRGLSKFTGLLAGGAAGAAALAFMEKAYDSFRESEKAVNLFAKAYQNLGNFTRKDIQDQVDLAEKLQKTTKYTDEQILAIQTQLVTYGLYGEELKKATVATLDLGVKTGSAESAAKLMGKAYQGQTDTLAKYGIKIDANIKGSEKYAAVLREVEARLGGLANTEGAALGPTDQLAKSVDTLYEKIGALVAGPLGDMVRILIQLVDVIPQVSSAVYDGDVKLSKTDGTLKTVFKSVWNNLNIFKALGGAAEEATKKIMGVKPIHEDLGGGKPGKPRLAGVNPDSAEEIKAQKLQQSEAIKNDKEYAKESERITEQITDIEGFELTERGQMYTRYFGKVNMEARKNAALQGATSKQLQINNKKMLADMEHDYIAAGKTFSGGWTQALDEMEQGMGNWKDSWNQVISGGIAPTQAALKEFLAAFTSTGGIPDIGKLAEKTFKGIRDAFYDMITQMIAKFLVFKMLTGMGLGGTAFGKFIGLATGGPIPGPKGAPMPVMAHGGEFMLSANVVDAIKAGRPTSGLAGGAAPAAGGGSATIYQTFQVSGGGNIKDTLREIASAARKGTTEALDAAKVLYKQGAKRSGETAL